MDYYDNIIKLGEDEALKDKTYDLDNDDIKLFKTMNELDILSIFYDYGNINTYNNIKNFYNEYYVNTIEELLK